MAVRSVTRMRRPHMIVRAAQQQLPAALGQRCPPAADLFKDHQEVDQLAVQIADDCDLVCGAGVGAAYIWKHLLLDEGLIQDRQRKLRVNDMPFLAPFDQIFEDLERVQAPRIQNQSVATLPRAPAHRWCLRLRDGRCESPPSHPINHRAPALDATRAQPNHPRTPHLKRRPCTMLEFGKIDVSGNAREHRP